MEQDWQSRDFKQIYVRNSPLPKRICDQRVKEEIQILQSDLPYNEAFPSIPNTRKQIKKNPKPFLQERNFPHLNKYQHTKILATTPSLSPF